MGRALRRAGIDSVVGLLSLVYSADLFHERVVAATSGNILTGRQQMHINLLSEKTKIEGTSPYTFSIPLAFFKRSSESITAFPSS